VQEQLGLKLESGTAPLDVIVIERIERPTANQKDQEGAPDKARPTTDYRLPTTD